MTDLGIIEGYFGRSWSWKDRAAVVSTLAPAGYRFFHYAPKIEAKLRKRWMDPFDADEIAPIARFAVHCREQGVRFGVGLTPFGAHLEFNTKERAALEAKIHQLDAIAIDDLAILFDDMDGAIDDLAARQAEIVDFVSGCTRATRLFMCPSYYSDDPVLDRVFGQRPADYLYDLGRMLDRAVAVYWTGEEVCSREISPGHCGKVADVLGRAPALWDNYPVNDGPRMAQYLHLRGFTGRAGLHGAISHHAINPASQPLLSCIPALTLPEQYRQGSDYCYGAAFVEAARTVCGSELANMLTADLLHFNDSGLERLSDELKKKLRDRYAALDHPASREIVDWLDGGYAITGEMLLTQ